jgi:hypothetical protein
MNLLVFCKDNKMLGPNTKTRHNCYIWCSVVHNKNCQVYLILVCVGPVLNKP